MDFTVKKRLLHAAKAAVLALGLCGVYALYEGFCVLADDGEHIQATSERAAGLAALRLGEKDLPRRGGRSLQAEFRSGYYALGRAIGEREPACPGTAGLFRAIAADYYALLPLADDIFRRGPDGSAESRAAFSRTAGHMSRLCLEAARSNIEARNLLLVRTTLSYLSLFILLLLLEWADSRFVSGPFFEKLAALRRRIWLHASASPGRPLPGTELREMQAGVESLAADLLETRNAWARLAQEAAGRRTSNKLLTRNLELAREKVMSLVGSLEAAREELQKEKTALKTAGEKLERSNKELEQFAYVASHDLKEPLRVMSSFSGLLAKKYAGRLDKDADDFIRFITEGAGRATALVDALFTYSKVTHSAREFTVVPGMTVLQKALFNLKVQLEEKKARVSCAGLPPLKGNEPQLIQLFQNVLSNALKFNAAPEPEIRVGFSETAGALTLYFSDNGIGIAPEHYERVFLVCQRLNSQEKYPGPGVGLALCKKIAENHGARMRVESRPGEGSTFFVEFPIQENAGAGTPGGEPAKKAAS